MTSVDHAIPERVLAATLGAPGAGAPPLVAEDLRELMEQVNATADQLSRTHAILQSEVTRLRRELEEANSKLRRSRALAALGEMAAGIAHEIRNPIAAIQLTAHTLAEEVADEPGRLDLCRKIRRAVDTADAIVRDVLLFARDMTIRPTPTTALELARHALDGCEALTVRGNVDVEVDVPDDSSCRLEVDTHLMTQAIGNLVRNAVEAMAERPEADRVLRVTGGRERVRGSDGGVEDFVVLTFEDTGPGIPPEVVDRMFNPFFTTRATGTGLGLAIVHRIVDAHRGQIQVRDAALGGARVDLCLPPSIHGPATPDESVVRHLEQIPQEMVVP